MTEFYSVSSSVSPFTAILWCLYPVALLVIIELLLGGGFDDDNNDDQDGGMLIPAYSRSDVWNFELKNHKDLLKLANNIDTTHISLIILTILMISSLTWLVLRTLSEGRKALTEINKDRSWNTKKFKKFSFSKFGESIKNLNKY